jgi:protocatechuate 3,4-dioxygenase beta subunit
VEVDGGPFGRQRTDADGHVRAERVAPGPYILRIRPPRGRARAHDLEVPDGDPEISERLRVAVRAEE